MVRHWSRFADFPELDRLRDEMGRLFERGGPYRPRLASANAYPALNLWEDEENLFVDAEIPGLELSELEIFVNGGDQLTIQGERKQPKGEKGTWHRQECGYGKFSRMVQLPSSVNSEKVNATYSNGVLTITLPKQEDAKPRRIQVKSQ